MNSELTPQYVLADLLGSADFPVEVLDPDKAAEIIIQRLADAGFAIRPAIEKDADAYRKEARDVALRRAIYDKSDLLDWLREFVDELNHLNENRGGAEREVLEVLRHGGYA